MLVVTSMNLFATESYSQRTKLSMELDHSTLKEVLSEIRRQTEFTVLYNSSDVKDVSQLDHDFKEATVIQILDKCLERTELTYEIKDKVIIIQPKGEKSVKKAPVQKQEKKTIKGTITDEKGDPMPGVTVVVVGSTRGVITDIDGGYEIEVDPIDKLRFSFIGMEDQEIDVAGKTQIDVKLLQKTENLDGVTVVAFAKQKKSSVMAAIETIRPSDLKVPSSNLTTALAGRMAGIISYQTSGEPGKDNAEFFIRGIMTFGHNSKPLILVDGMELTTDDLARINPDDIASFSIMKDATSTALYGARGANGVVYVTTKEGVEGEATVNVRYETSLSEATKNIELADPITYMLMHNEAVRTRNPIGLLPYSLNKVDQTIAGGDPVLYPTTDWYKELFEDRASSQRLNVSVSGGGKVARYYLAASVTQDNGSLKVDGRNNFNSNIDLKKYGVRSNVNLNLTETTKAKILFDANFDKYTGPLDGGGDIYKKVMRTNPVLFRPYYEADEDHKYTNHILFGNSGDGNYFNPYADLVKGYKDYDRSKFNVTLELHQDLDFLTEGLKASATVNGNKFSFFDVRRQYQPYFYEPMVHPETKKLSLKPLNEESGTEYINYVPGGKKLESTFYMESKLFYNRLFNDKHDIGAMLVYTMREKVIAFQSNLQKSLPYRNMGLSGRATYGYNDKYFGEFSFGYNGSERFSKKHRFGFFPSAGIGYMVSNEAFFEPLKRVVTKFKLKSTYGLVGNDAIGKDDDRFFYLSQVNMNDFKRRGYTFGKNRDNFRSGVSISRYANDEITWETAKKLNLGVELTLFDKIEIHADYFTEHRENILMNRVQYASMGLQSNVRANVGEAKGRGVEVSLDYQDTFGPDLWIQARANFTYATNEIYKKEEPDYSATPWLSKVGQNLKQKWGLIAERLFVDEEEVKNSPVQGFGEYHAGDIKYRDVNGDGKVTNLDIVPIGNPEVAEINFGFGFSAGYKGLDISCFFQGATNVSFWVNPVYTAPFLDVTYRGENFKDKKNNQLLKVWADSYWSETNRDVYAKWPRLSETPILNNMQTSTWFMQDGSYLRMKSAEIGYTLPENLVNKFKLTKCRVYLSGSNLFTFSNFKLWDPGMKGNGLGYPIQRVYNAGINLTF